jgi:vancomycin resistance protein YoaR
VTTVLEANVSAEEMYPERGATGRRLDDAYTTRPLPTHTITDHSADLPLIGAPQAARRTTGRPPSRGASGIVYLFLSLLVLVMLGAGGGLYYLDRSYQGKIYPNVTVQGLNVGELTQQEAEAALRARYGAFLRHPATLTYGEQSWQPSYADIGITFDFKGAIDNAYRAGRGNGLIENLQEVYAIWENGLDLPVHVTFDQNKLREYVAGVSADLNHAPIDAQLRLDGTTVSTQPSQIGRQVLVDQTVGELTAALATFKPHTVALKTRDIAPRLNDAAVADARARLESILQGPFTLEVEKKQYVWMPEEIALMLDIGRVPQNSAIDSIAIQLNAYQVGRRVRQIADETGRGSVNPRVEWNNGDLRILKPGKPGLRLDEAQAGALIGAAISGSNRVIALPVREVAPQVTAANLHTLGINELVSIGRSDFTGSAEYRINNIGVGMEILNGILIAPGEEFSFNNNIGSIDARNGFVEGYAIIQDRTQLEFGGGICQDSTTLFRAAFWAGLPITERWGHSFYISWYDKYGLGSNGNGPGLDATIFTGGPDLKFVNDTGNWLLMQSTSNARTGVAEVSLYGTKLNRTVTLAQSISKRIPAPPAPKIVTDRKQPLGTSRQSDHARGGMTIAVYRTITENGVRKAPELFQTNFRAWPNIYVFNPADIGPDGRPLIPFGAQPAPQPTPEPAPAPAPDQPAPAPEQPVLPPEQPPTSDG